MVIHALTAHTSCIRLLESVRLSLFVHMPMSSSCIPADDIKVYSLSPLLSFYSSLHIWACARAFSYFV